MSSAGTIIYLNGSSSAGKSTLARALQEEFEEPYLDLGIDTLFAAVTPRFNRSYRHDSPQLEGWRGTAWKLDEREMLVAIEFDEWGRRMVFGLHEMVAALARAGNNVIVDDVIFEQDMARSAARALAPLGAHLIGVHCPLEVLVTREKERGDRYPGLARYLHRRPHEHIPCYDFEVDTSALTPEECARAVRRHVASGIAPRAFRALLEG